MNPQKNCCHLFGHSQVGSVIHRPVHLYFAETLLNLVGHGREVITKAADAKAAFHFAPDHALTIISIQSGEHTIKFFADDGKGLISLQEITLKKGDVAVFYDYRPNIPVLDRSEWPSNEFEEAKPRPGHMSVAGPDGAMYFRSSVPIVAASKLCQDFLGLTSI